jgi:hypothetical protein
MEATNATKLSLRILYTINSTPQYILARSPSPVLVTPVPTSTQAEPNYLYATVSLKTCLDTICCSSPELVQDPSRDYSVYVLDPLEASPSPGPVSIITDPSSFKTNGTAPRGVAVGLGLMSWALRAEDQDACTVNGTLIKLGTGQAALEVIFALREVRASLILPLGPASTVHCIADCIHSEILIPRCSSVLGHSFSIISTGPSTNSECPWRVIPGRRSYYQHHARKCIQSIFILRNCVDIFPSSPTSSRWYDSRHNCLHSNAHTAEAAQAKICETARIASQK